MKTLAIVFGIAVAMVTVPAWAASSGSLHAMSKVSAASALSSDELSAVEGGHHHFRASGNDGLYRKPVTVPRMGITATVWRGIPTSSGQDGYRSASRTLRRNHVYP